MIARANIYHGGYNISADSSEWELVPSAAIHDVTTVKLTSVARVGGNITGSISGKGYWDSDTDTELRGELGESQPFTACIPDNTYGNDAWLAVAKNSNYSLGASAGDIIPFTYSAQTTGPFVKGKTLVYDTHTVAGTDTGNAVEVTQTTGDVMVANFHVTAKVGMAANAAIYSSATEGGEYVEHAVFDALMAIGSEQITWTTDVDHDWWKVQFSQAGATVNTTYLVSLGVC